MTCPSLGLATDLMEHAYGYDGPAGVLAGGREVLGRFDHPLVRAMLYRVGDETVAFVVGTETLRQWLSNANARPVEVDGYRVHAGFWHAFGLLRPWLEEVRPDRIVGHSRGGSVAILACWRLLLPGIALCPARVFKGRRPPLVRVCCVVVPDDRVTVLPFLPIGGAWSHGGLILRLPDSEPDLLEDHTCPRLAAELETYGVAHLVLDMRAVPASVPAA